MKKVYIKGACILMIAALLILDPFDLAIMTGKIQAEQTEESISIGKEAETLILQLKYNETRKLLENNHKDFAKDDKLLRAYGILEYHFYNNYEKAQELIEEAVRLNPRDYDNYVELGNVYRVQGNYDKAIKNYEKAIKYNDKCKKGLWSSENSIAYKLIGNCYLDLNEKENAIKAYEKAIEHNPYNIEVNASLHRLYVEKEEYKKAYDIWKTDNLIEENKEHVYKQISDWNEQYKAALLASSYNKHYELGRLYSDLVLYDEAKLEYEKALYDEEVRKEVEDKLHEINSYLSFREEAKNIIDEHYRLRCVNGTSEDSQLYNRLEPAYKKVAILFPGLEEKTIRAGSWIKQLDTEIEKKFYIKIRYIYANGSMLGCHFGRIIDNSKLCFSQWGKEIDLRVVTLKNMVTNGLDEWRSMGRYGVGGWGGSLTEVVRVIQNQGNDGMIMQLSVYDEDIKAMALEEAAKYDSDIGDKGPLDLYYSAELSTRFLIKQIETDVDKAKKMGIPDTDINKYLYNRLEKEFLIETTIFAHESQHSIDSMFNISATWVGENEYRAKLAQLAYGHMHFINLASFYTPMIGSTNTRNTHTNADTQVIKDIVQYIYNHNEKYPEIDITQNILAQLIKLEEEDLKEIGIAIFEEKYPELKYQ